MGEDKGYWAIGDVHGCPKSLRALVSKLGARRLYLLGDLVDRGPDSKGVLDYCMKNPGLIRPLLGNHDDMMLQSYKAPHSMIAENWLEHGGQQTLDSFGAKHPGKIPSKYIEFVKTLPLIRRVGTIFLSHAGPNLNLKDPFADTHLNRQFILWNRSVKPPRNKSLSIVIGHTPVTMGEVKSSVPTRKVMVDGGCVFGGQLVAFNLHTHKIITQSLLDDSEYAGRKR